MGQPTVFLVEDDRSIRDYLVSLIRTERIQVEAYSQPSKLLRKSNWQSQAGCLVLDLHLPEMTGLELYDKLVERGCEMPFIVISGHGVASDAATAMRKGAVDFLEKPFYHDVFLDRVREALEIDLIRRRELADREEMSARLDSLTAREREILDLILTGYLTKQIASKLHISIKTVEAHRSHITKKIGANSAIQLVQKVTKFLG